MGRRMFELGSSLRDARRKRGLELDAVQRATRIRRRYLEAIEQERFDVLPGVAYARGFLREYAEFLGLDGNLYVEEYNERFAPRDELPIAAVPQGVGPTRRRPLPGLALLGLVAALVAVGVGIAAWRLSGGSSTTGSPPASAPAPTTTARKPRPKPAPAPPPKPARPTRLVLTAARGDCWLAVRLGSASGRVLYEDVLHQGGRLVFGLKRPLWVRVGAGANLDARAGGRPVSLPAQVGNLLIRGSG